MPGLEGTRLGRYRLQQRLGHGGMSEVYLAYDELMHREIAIKVMSSTHADYIERFQREAEALGNLHHNHILPAFDYGEQEPWHYLVMPYIDHESLSELLDRGPLSLEHAGEILSQIASALEHAHEHGILHRDIKPSNILLRDSHYAYLADFGLAKAVDGSGRVTHTGVLMGTPEYMAPELADGIASTSSDLYALGILLYQMITGRLPFTGETALAVYLRQMHEQPAPPSRINPAISPNVEQVILSALDKDPRRRFPTPNGLAEAYFGALYAKVPQQDTIRSMTQTPQIGVILSESGKMPPLYNSTNSVEDELAQTYGSRYAQAEPYHSDIRVIQGGSGFDSDSSIVVQEEKLVLPAYSPRAQAETSITADQTIIQQPSRLPSSTPQYVPIRPTNPLGAPNNRNSFMVTGLMGMSFLLIIMSVILFAVFAYNSNREAERINTLTAQAISTNQASRAGEKQTKVATATRTVVIRLSPQQVPLATASAITSSAPAVQDDLSTDFIGGWYVDNTSCTFVGGTYHVIVKQANFLQTCASSIFSFDNAALQVDVSLLSGNNAGLIFRANNQQYYDFGIDDQGKFFFRRHDSVGSGVGIMTDLIPGTKSPAIAHGKKKNTLLVIANGSDFKLFINGNFVGEQQDSSYRGGQVGFGVGTSPSENTGEASFSNFKEYSIPS
jgi:serine/threonine protein kinase